MTRSLRNALAVLLYATTFSGQAQDGSRLLPDSFVEIVGFSWKQDGRAVDLKIVNPKAKWVLQRLAVEVKYESAGPKSTDKTLSTQKADRASGAASPPSRSSLEEFLDQLPEQPEIYPFMVEVLPGMSLSTHLELKSRRKVSSIRVLEIRGREQSLIERARGLIW